MGEISYSVSEASDFLEVPSHVLRYWEEELSLPIQRNEMGHRFYTRWDIQVILSIKELKKKLRITYIVCRILYILRLNVT